MSDRERLRHRVLAFAGLSVLLTGLLAAASFVFLALAVFGVTLLIIVAAVGISLVHRLRLGQRLRAVLASTAGAFPKFKPRVHDLGIRRRAQRLGIRGRDAASRAPRRAQRLGNRAREAGSRAPGRANELLARAIRTYALIVHSLLGRYAMVVYRLRMRYAEALGADGRLATSIARVRPRPFGRSRREALVLNEIGVRLRREGAHEEAAERHRVALAIVRNLGDEQAEAMTLNSLALALAQGGAEAEAVQHLEQARAVLRGLGDEAHEAQVVANLGIVHRRQGHSEQAVQLLHEALDKLPPQSPAYRRVEEELRRAS